MGRVVVVVVEVGGGLTVARAHTCEPVANRPSADSAPPFAESNTTRLPSLDSTDPDTDGPAEVTPSIPIDSDASLTLANGLAPPTQRFMCTSVDVS